MTQIAYIRKIAYHGEEHPEKAVEALKLIASVIGMPSWMLNGLKPRFKKFFEEN